jgi:hypothetical protein
MYGTTPYGRAAYGATRTAAAADDFPDPTPGIGKLLLMGLGSYLLVLFPRVINAHQ